MVSDPIYFYLFFYLFILLYAVCQNAAHAEWVQTCRYTIIGMNGENNEPRLECDDPQWIPDQPYELPPGMGSGGSGGPGGAAELQRQTTCAQANADWASRDCSARRLGDRPRDNFNILFNFPFPNGYSYDYLRGAALAFHQALWDDLTGGVWNNFNDSVIKFNQACEAGAGGIRAISVGFCKTNVDTYFGGTFFSSISYASFQQSQAAIDARPNRDGQICTNLAAVRTQNQC